MNYPTLKPTVVCVLELHRADLLWRTARRAMSEAMESFERIVSEEIDRHRGESMHISEADFAGRFDRVGAAIDWVGAVDEASRAVCWPDVCTDGAGDERPKLHLSAGVDVGVVGRRVSARTGQYLAVGPPVRTAAALARTLSAGGAESASGRIALSPPARDLVDEADASTSVSTSVAGDRRLHVLPIDANESGDAHRDGAPDAGDVRHNLPQFEGGYIDRTREFGTLAAAFDRGDRHVTICGTAGAGKSRLAVEFAHKWLGRAAHHRDPGSAGVGQAWFCDLSEIGSVDEALFSVARTVGVQIPAPETVAAMNHAVAGALDGRGPVLLILDDIDLIDDAFDATVQRWVSEADQLHVIGTRRRQPPTDIPVVDVDPLGRASATALLEERLASPLGSPLALEDPDTLAAVVDRSGRLPLAVELLAGAAGRDVPPGRPQTSGERPTTASLSGGRAGADRLEEAIAGSWDMLEDVEQTALAACTVFPGSFSPSAATAVIGATADLQEPAAADLVVSLQQSSLIRTDRRRADRVRLTLLAPVAEFVGRCADQASVDTARDASIEYMAGWATNLRDGLRGDHEPRWIDRGTSELVNLYEAIDKGWADHLPDALCILEGLGELDVRVGPLGGFKQRADHAVQAARRASDDHLLMRALRVRGERLMWTGDYEAAERDYRGAHRLAEQLDLPRAAAMALSSAGLSTGMLGREKEGLSRVRQAAELVAEESGFETIALLNNAAIMARNRHLNEEALDYHHQALVRARRLGNPYSQASVLFLLGSTLRRVHQPREAIRSLEQANRLFRSIGDRRGQLVSYHELAECFNVTHQDERAEQCYQEATELAAAIGDREYSGVFWLGRGRARFGRREYARAETDLLEATIAVEQVGHIHLKIAAQLYLAATYAALDRLPEAQSHFDRVEAIFADTDVTRAKPIYEVLYGYLDAARARREADDNPQQATELAQAAYDRATLAEASDEPVPREAIREAERLQVHLDRAVESGRLPANAAASGAVLRVAEDVRWFAVDDDDPVDISRRGAIGRILRALVDKRLAEPDQTLNVHQLLDAGWPNEASVGQSGQQRTYMAISRLRGLGLDDVVETVDDGYRIAPEYTPVWVQRRAASSPTD